jgi:hypothetical protein
VALAAGGAMPACNAALPRLTPPGRFRHEAFQAFRKACAMPPAQKSMKNSHESASQKRNESIFTHEDRRLRET